MTEPTVSELLVKAVRALPQDEQDAILGGLLDRASAPQAAAALSAHHPFTRLPDLSALAAAVPGNPRLGERGSNLRVVPVRMSAEQHDALKQWCESNDFSMATVIRGLVDRFLTSQARPEG
jgi:hypothetical protein